MMQRKTVFRLMLLAVVGIVLVGLVGVPSGSDNYVIKTFEFKKATGINIEVLTYDRFEELFGDNPLIPGTDEEVLELARKLYTRDDKSQEFEECGESSLRGALFASLSNPLILDTTREEVDQIVADFEPALPETYTSGHFRFLYTTTDPDPDHNVTLAAVQATAAIINDNWDDYVANFTTPKHYVDSCGNQKIDIKVWYDPGYHGSTHSSWNYINLNSKTVVMNGTPCKRETTPGHELFHRCQYTYGYITGTSIDKWAVEGTAAWSQKYNAPHVGDWMDRMQTGLATPDRTLVGSSRSYDACHFWAYFGQRGGDEADLIEDAWAEYSVNGHNMRAAVEDVCLSRLGQSLDSLVQWWSFANFHKDFTNASASFDYEEDEWVRTCGGATHGPLDQVVRTTRTLGAGGSYNLTTTVSEYGADYYRFNLGAGATSITFSVNGTGSNFGYARWAIDGTQYQHYGRSAGSVEDFGPYTYSYAGMDAVAVMVVGNPNSGTYTITASGS